MPQDEPRLTSLAHGGGCGCKLSPAVLGNLLASVPAGAAFPNLLVGTETGDDAAVYRLNDSQALIATTDFFTPIVDDPFDFGRIAATNALSDVYAMGGTPIMALALLGMPLGKLSVQTMGASSRAAPRSAPRPASRWPAATRSTVRSRSTAWWRWGWSTRTACCATARREPGDVLVLTKGLGVGIFSAALKRARCRRRLRGHARLRPRS